MKYLIEESPLVVQPTLIKVFGLKKAILIQQIQYWAKYQKNIRDGISWVWNTYPAWIEQLPFYSERTLKRDMKELEEAGVILSTSKYNRMNTDRTKWYCLEKITLNKAVEDWAVEQEKEEKGEYFPKCQNGTIPKCQNGTMHNAKMALCNHYTSTETTKRIQGKDESFPDKPLGTTLKSGKKPKYIKASVTVTDILDISLEKAKPSLLGDFSYNNVSKFWLETCRQEYDMTPLPLTSKSIGQFKHLISKLGAENSEAYQYALLNWDSFSYFVKSKSGGHNPPKQPQLGFMLVSVDYIPQFFKQSLYTPSVSLGTLNPKPSSPSVSISSSNLAKKVTLAEMEAIELELQGDTHG